MKRDMDLVRAILIDMESAPFNGPLELSLDGYSAEEISYHVMLLHQAELIHALGGKTFGTTPLWQPLYLTWQGHEFLEAAKDNTRWNRAKRSLIDTGAPMLFELLKTALLSFAQQALLGTKL